jgi:hypothetical protein
MTKRKPVIARLRPIHPKPRPPRPNFLRLLREIYGRQLNELSGAELVAEQRGRY